MARKVRYPMPIFMFNTLGSTLQAMLSLKETHEVHMEALAASDSIPVRRWKITMFSGLCMNQALASDWEAAHRYALEAVAIRDAAPARLIGFDFYRQHETEALLRGGEERLACEDVRRLGEQRVGRNRRFRLVHLRMLAVLGGTVTSKGRWGTCGRRKPWPKR